MSGRRRIQRSVRVSVAAALASSSAGLVVGAVAASTAVGPAALTAAVAGAAATRIMYAEVVRCRRDAARGRAEQARAFDAVHAATHDAHATSLAASRSLVTARDGAIVELAARARVAERRADEAAVRAERESRRADDAQARLSSLLDDVLACQVAPAASDGPTAGDDLPAVVDMLAWEERAIASRHGDEFRRHA